MGRRSHCDAASKALRHGTNWTILLRRCRVPRSIMGSAGRGTPAVTVVDPSKGLWSNGRSFFPTAALPFTGDSASVRSRARFGTRISGRSRARSRNSSRGASRACTPLRGTRLRTTAHAGAAIDLDNLECSGATPSAEEVRVSTNRDGKVYRIADRVLAFETASIIEGSCGSIATARARHVGCRARSRAAVVTRGQRSRGCGRRADGDSEVWWQDVDRGPRRFTYQETTRDRSVGRANASCSVRPRGRPDSHEKALGAPVPGSRIAPPGVQHPLKVSLDNQRMIYSKRIAHQGGLGMLPMNGERSQFRSERRSRSGCGVSPEGVGSRFEADEAVR